MDRSSRITGPATGIPFAPHLEAEVVPTAERIVVGGPRPPRGRLMAFDVIVPEVGEVGHGRRLRALAEGGRRRRRRRRSALRGRHREGRDGGRGLRGRHPGGPGRERWRHRPDAPGHRPHPRPRRTGPTGRQLSAPSASPPPGGSPGTVESSSAVPATSPGTTAATRGSRRAEAQPACSARGAGRWAWIRKA